MWGQVAIAFIIRSADRIIPTRVGTSTSGNIPFSVLQDHPHACGDKFLIILILFNALGSSPRVWGQDSYRSRNEKRSRIIPTRVGTSFYCGFHSLYFQDHPHACGDKNFIKFRNRGIVPTRVGTRLKKSRKIAVLQNQPLRFPLTFHRSFV